MDRFPVDSQALIREFTVKELEIDKYLEALKSVKKTFNNVEIEKVPRSENIPASALARLVSAWEGGIRRYG